MTFMSTCITHTHVMLRYGYVGVGLGGAGWGGVGQ